MQVSTTLVRHCIMTLYSINIVLASVLFNSCICFIKKQPCERIAVGIKFTKPQTHSRRSFCPFLRSQRFCATHQNAPRTKDVQIIGELTNSQWKWLRLLKLHKRSFYSAAIDKKTVEKLLLLSFCCGVIQTHFCSCSFFIHYIIMTQQSFILC